MENNLSNRLLNICIVLNKFYVEYLIVGGTAVALHGYFRFSSNAAGATADKPDFDFWFNPTYDNYFKLLHALGELGQDVSEFIAEQAPNPKKSFFKYEFEQFTLDFLPALKISLRFRIAYNRKEVVTINGTDLTFLCYDDLKLDKQTHSRPKDISDIEHLEIIKKDNISRKATYRDEDLQHD